MPERPISQLMAYWAERAPDKLAITHDHQSITRAEFDARTNRLARAYAEMGVQPDDFVTIGLPNSIVFFEAAFAVWKLGATPQPVSARLPAGERDAIIEIANPSLLVGFAANEGGSTPTVPVGFEPDANLSDSALPERTARYLKAMTSGGSTGRPKLIVSEQPAVFDPDDPFFNFPMDSAVLVPGPLYHNGPFLFAIGGLFKGNHVAVTTRFDPLDTLRMIEAVQADTVYMVPTMMQRIWKLPEADRLRFDLSSLRMLWHLAAPCPVWLKEAFIGWLGPERIFELYAGTEAQGVTVITGDEWLEHRGSVGKPTPGCRMKIVGADGAELGPGEIGEVYLLPDTGQGSTYHYVGAEPQAIEGGWESLGDMGYRDAEGYLYLTDRMTDMILSGGANIYPAEVEAAIDAFPGVRSSAVIGLPHEDMGNTIHAIIDAPGVEISEAALLDHLARQLLRYKIPRSFEYVSKPLRDDAGKMRRTALREERI